MTLRGSHATVLALLAMGIAAAVAGLGWAPAPAWQLLVVAGIASLALAVAVSLRAGARLARSLTQEAAQAQREQVAQNTALRRELDVLARVPMSMREGLLALGEDGRIALINPALREMLLLPADAVGKTPLEVIRHAELKALLDTAASSRTPRSAELDLGLLKPRRLLAHASRLSGGQGGVLAVFVDVTELRRLESLRRDFVANVSHELRTPVAAVRAAAETLREALSRDPTAAPDFLDIIHRHALRLDRLLSDLLDLSRIESRELRLRFESLELAGVVRHVLALFAERAAARGQTLSASVASELGAVRADRRALEQVLGNLIENAVKYADEGARISVRAERDGALARLSVEDSGPGIAPEHLPRLFERFYRVDAGRSRDVGGTGLGLAIVKHLVEAMDGVVAVHSAPGHGTSFRFTLPVA